MHVLITGAAGMLGRKLTRALVNNDKALGGSVTRLTLVDLMHDLDEPDVSPTQRLAVDLSEPGKAAQLMASRPDIIFHLAAVVSGEAEADFGKGYRVNLDGMRALLEAIREEATKAAYCPKLIFASSIAVLGAPFPDQIGDDHVTAPLTSYGTQKAMCELLLADCSRRGIIDGVGLRLPTICVRPGKPNRAASGFFSNIIREPLLGKEAVLPVDPSVRHWFASPRAATGFMLHAANIDTARIGPRRNLTMPGVSVTVSEQINALERFAGTAAVRLIRHKPDAAIQRIVAGWPSNFDARRATELGFKAEAGFDDIIRAHIEEESAG
jgi:D-erythronate 2-dehydrogenase